MDVPSFSGAFGILPNHVPALAVLSPGVVTVYEDEGATKKFFVSSGSITVNEDSSVQILAEEAHALEDLGEFSMIKFGFLIKKGSSYIPLPKPRRNKVAYLGQTIRIRSVHH